MPVTEITVRELETLIQSAVREVFLEVLRDPDAGLQLRPEFEARLLEAQEYVASGGCLLSMDVLTSKAEDSLHSLTVWLRQFLPALSPIPRSFAAVGASP